MLRWTIKVFYILYFFSHSVCDVELEEKDTEGDDKDNVQLDDLTDRVIVWLTWLLKQKSAYYFYH